MYVLREANLVPFDVDGTLVKEVNCFDDNLHHTIVNIPHPLRGSEIVTRIVMTKNVQLLKDMSTRGRGIQVWSAAGHEWAEAVVRALELQNFVALVSDKPIAYVDDLECQEFMGHRIFLTEDKIEPLQWMGYSK